MHTRVVVYVSGAVIVALLAAVVAWRLLGAGSTYETALGTLPEATLRTTFTDWAHVRSDAGGASLGAGSSRSKVEGFLGRAYDLDLTSGSAVAESTYAMQEKYGFSPLDAEWEAFGQSRQGQVDVMRVEDDVDLAGVERALRRLGYTPPRGGSGQGGTWVGGADLVATDRPGPDARAAERRRAARRPPRADERQRVVPVGRDLGGQGRRGLAGRRGRRVVAGASTPATRSRRSSGRRPSPART